MCLVAWSGLLGVTLFFPDAILTSEEQVNRVDRLPDGLQRCQGFCGRLSREQYGEFLSGCTEDLSSSTDGVNSVRNQFQNLCTNRFPVGIGIVGELVDADNCNGKSFTKLSDGFVVGQAIGNAGEFVTVGPLIKRLK